MIVVSMLFDLQSQDPSNRGTRPLSFYLEKGRPTLELELPMVLLCDATTRPFLESVRGSRPTVYVERALQDYDLVRTMLPVITANRVGNPAYSDTNRATPLYWLLCMMKTYALLEAKSRMPDTTYLWLDLGISHMARGLPTAVAAIAAAPRPKIACCYIHYRTKEELYPMESFLRDGGPAAIAASAFTVEASYVERLYTAMLAVFYEQISRGIGHSDEQCLVYVADRHPEWFSFYVGDYYSCLTNYHSLREDIASVQTHVLPGARRERREDILGLIQTYGREDLERAVVWHPECSTAKLILAAFEHFIALGPSFHPGWGSYLFDGQTYRYHLETLKKQEALVRAGAVSTHVLEVGVYLGHSLLLLLLSNPTLRITCIDNDARFAPRAVAYLNAHFGNRVTFHLGSAADVLPTLPLATYDCIHIDADHYDDADRQQFTLAKPLATPRALVVFDDYEAVHTVIDSLLETAVLERLELPGCLWTNIVTQLCE